ncbi:pyruvate, orthophosphate dikinase [Desulfobacula phenolica]|uniref:Pyruvate, orthophosphate dikinase n=1 Tax=Desulfobacula phenolica TaxID=90732 RepID=A0A1H2INU9_9BACT|nr:pyruvate, orthophosphate dikinase [Desulfobacula phenolica]
MSNGLSETINKGDKFEIYHQSKGNLVKSRALEVNLSDTKVDVIIDSKYEVFLDIVSSYVGILNRMNVFLKELSHPYKNWEFIVSEARHFSLQYFYLYKSHPDGGKALDLFVDIFLDSFESDSPLCLKTRAADNLMLFLQHIVKESDHDFDLFLHVIEKAVQKIESYEGRDFYFFVRSYYQPDKIAKALLVNLKGDAPIFKSLNLFLIKFYEYSFDYWLKQEDPICWIGQSINVNRLEQGLQSILKSVSHEKIRLWQKKLEVIIQELDQDPRRATQKLTGLVSYQDFVSLIRAVPQKIMTQSGDDLGGFHLKLTFLFYIIHIPGLSTIHVQALRDINTTLTHLIGDKDFKKDINIVNQTFLLLKEHKGKYPETVLDCIHKIGDSVYKASKIDLINHFIDRAVDHGFQFPMIEGTGDDWQIKSNCAHVKNIRVFLDLISQHPKKSRRLLSALIISLAIGGVFIKDTDLFPRDITNFLNSDIEPVFNLVKQLARLLPAFFNEIGAEGQLRDISTELDESCQRKDQLIHFLRKQCHVESSSRIVEFIKEVILFWKTGDKKKLEPHVPPSIYRDIKVSGPFVDGPRIILNNLKTKDIFLPKDYMMHTQKAINKLINEVEGVTEPDKSRVKMIFGFYRLLNQKYMIDNLELKKYLSSFKSENLPDTAKIVSVFEEKNLEHKILSLLSYMKELKKIILSDRIYEANEAIYHKRHFAVDIPSMYGSYNEAKFDALGLTLRVESILNVWFEELVNSIDLQVITKATFKRIYSILDLFRSALSLDGIISNQLDVQMDFLKFSMDIRTCTFTQYLDIFKGFTRAVADIIHDHFNNIHSNNLFQIESRLGKDQILEKYLPKEGSEKQKSKLDQRVADIFFRDRIATSLGLQQMDVFLNRILHTLFQQSEKLSQTHLSRLLNYDPKYSAIEVGSSDPISNNIIFLGNKGLNLIKLKKIGVAVPEGFIITTEVFKCREIINNYKPANINFKKYVAKMVGNLEKRTQKKFGDPKNPLLLSVRSGSSISQPGMLDSFLNVGLNEEIAASIAGISKNPWFAWDSYRRFIQGYGMAFGIKRDEFDHIIYSKKKEFGAEFKRLFTGDQMKGVALVYKQLLLDSGIDLIESPIDQLFLSINKVFYSWESKRGKDYRRIMGISDDWGTAVTVQSMVFGNLSRQSGSGVVFSHSPKLPGDTVRLWGDFTIGNQGEDVVSGLVKTLPISEIQRELEKPDSTISLEKSFPHIYLKLKEVVHRLVYDEGWNPQEIEFTFEGENREDLFILQARDMSLRDRKKIVDFDVTPEFLDKAYLGQGIGVSGGAMSGKIVFTLEEIDGLRKSHPGISLILLRNDTVPDDILEIDAADGILTARGGLTSHAAVVTYSLGKTCVVGCENLVCNELEKVCLLNGVKMVTGDYISINGQKGSVYKGAIEIN